MVLREAMERAGLTPGDDHVPRLRDACSGVGTAAAAMEHVTNGNFRYMAASESKAAQRGILQRAWAHRGLRQEMIYGDAYGAESAAGPEADVYIMSPECGKWSREGNTTRAQEMEETEKVGIMMQYAARVKPAVVIMESAEDLLGEGHTRASGAEIERQLKEALPGHEWRAQVVDAHRHGGVPMHRRRAFWVGTRKREHGGTPTRSEHHV